MGMLDGEVVGEVMAIKIAEIGAQGAERTFTIVSKDDNGLVSTCRGSYGYVFETSIVEGDVRNGDLEKALPIIMETGVVQPMSMVRGHFKSKDGKWFHIDLGFGNHFFVRDLIARTLLAHFAGRGREDMYAFGIDAVKEILKNAGGGSGMSTERVHDRVWGGRKRECGEVNCLLWDEVESKNINDKGRMEYGAN